MLITVVLQVSQQLSGINAVFYYSTAIFKQANYSPNTSQYINLGLGATNILITIVSVFLMDRLGRRILHMTGLGGMLITVTLLVISLLVTSTPAWNKLSVAMVVLFVASFGVGPGSIPWLITAELFSQAFRVPASSIAVLVNWSANFMIAIGFKPLFQVSYRRKDSIEYEPLFSLEWLKGKDIFHLRGVIDSLSSFYIFLRTGNQSEKC